MKQQLVVFIARWILNSVGLWIAIRLLGSGYSGAEIDASWLVFLLGGLIFSLVNAVLKPAVIILALPAILLTLGLFTFIVNGLMVYISIALTPGLHMTFINSIVAGLILSLVNYIVSNAIEFEYSRVGERKL